VGRLDHGISVFKQLHSLQTSGHVLSQKLDAMYKKEKREEPKDAEVRQQVPSWRLEGGLQGN
jgi:hypothetical protein